MASERGLSSFGLGRLGRLAKLTSLIQSAPASCRFELSMAHSGLALAKTRQPQLPARGARWPRDSHNVLLWNGVRDARGAQEFCASHSCANAISLFMSTRRIFTIPLP